MIELKVKTRSDVKKVLRAEERARKRNLYQTAGLLRTTAARSIRIQGKTVGTKHGKPGKPPKTRLKALKHAIAFHVNQSKTSAVIGPLGSKVAGIGGVHEFGKFYKGHKYKQRPFMGPANEKVAPIYGKKWRGSIK